MSPSPFADQISPALATRLQRVGSALTDAAAPQRSTRPAMSTSDPTPGPRRGVLAALVVVIGGLTIGALAFAGGPKDPVIGVIPRNITHRDILWMRFNVPAADDAPQWLSLVSVDGVDVFLSEDTTGVAIGSGSYARTKIADKDVWLSQGGAVSSASWTADSNRSFHLTTAPNSQNFRVIVEAVIRQSVAAKPAPKRPTEFTSLAMQEIERWDNRGPSLLIELKALGDRPSDQSEQGLTNTIFSQEAMTSAAVATRMFRASGIPVSPFRSGRYLVSAPLNYRDVRPLRMSEFRRTVRAIDRARASEINAKQWARIAPGVQLATTDPGLRSAVMCMRTTTEVACSPFLLNRLIGSRWVYSTNGETEVRVEGVAQKPISSGPGAQRIFLFPASVTSIVTTSSPNGRDLVETTVTRPTY